MAEQTRHSELSEIFNQALELDPIEREKFLDEACQANPDLRQRVESLLKSFEKSEDFIEKPVVEVAQIRPADETVPLENAGQLAETSWQNRPHLPKNTIPPKLLCGDLDNIILMALRKEPGRRYLSVADLSDDISNYLNGLPVAARPNTFFYRAAKFYARNKTASIVGLFLALSLIGGIIATSWQSVVASRQRDRAERRFADVRQLSNSLLFEITPNIENLNGSTKARELLVKRALEYLDSLANESNDDLQLQSELAAAYEKVGELQSNSQKPSLNDLSGAIESYRKAQNIRRNLPDTLENQKGLAQNLRQYSDVIFAGNDVKGSLQASTDALGIYEKSVAENPQSIELRIAYIETKLDYGATFSSNNQYGEAIPIFRQTLVDLAQLDQNNQEILRLTSVAFAQLGNALSWNENQPEAESEMAKAVKIAEDLIAKYPNDSGIRRNTFRIYTLASGIYEEIKNDVSLEFAQKALQTVKDSIQSDPNDLLAKANLAQASSRVGICLVNVNKIPEAILSLQTSEEIYRQLSAQDPKNLAYQRNLGILALRVGDAQRGQKNYAEALKIYQESADLLENLAQMDEKNTLARRDQAQSLKNVGEMQISLNQKTEAKQTFQKALQILADLKTKNAIGKLDEKMVDQIEVALQKLPD